MRQFESGDLARQSHVCPGDGHVITPAKIELTLDGAFPVRLPVPVPVRVRLPVRVR
jgi:hypothetical protein